MDLSLVNTLLKVCLSAFVAEKLANGPDHFTARNLTHYLLSRRYLSNSPRVPVVKFSNVEALFNLLYVKITPMKRLAVVE